MTGPEHYKEAERMAGNCAIEVADAEDDADGEVSDITHAYIALAQVHATLALAAATALGREGEGRTQPSKDRAAWFDAASECRKAQA